MDSEGVNSNSGASSKRISELVKLIDGYRTRGHLFTKTNPVRDRRKYQPSFRLKIWFVSKDLATVFNAGKLWGLDPSLRIKSI